MKCKYVLALILIKSISSYSQTKELSIGDNLPNIEISPVINFTDDHVNLQQFRGKLLILDFWATWCSPCIAAMPKLQTLQQEFGDKIQILSVTRESKIKVEDFLAKMKKAGKLADFPSVVDDTILRTIFEHNELPHTVWISEQGKIIAITSGDEITKENIARVLKGENAFLPFKKDVKEDIYYEHGESVFPVVNTKINSERFEFVKAPESSIVIHSTLTKYIPGMPSGINVKDPTLLTVPNSSIFWLYRVALWKMRMETMSSALTVVDVKDSVLYRKITDEGLSYQESTKWFQNNTYNYELKVPPNLVDSKFDIMLTDINRYFTAQYGIEGVIEKRQQKYLALVRTTPTDLLATRGGNSNIEKNAFYLKIQNQKISSFLAEMSQPLQLKPNLVDETNFKGNIDIELNCKLTDLVALNRELKKYGLKFEEKVKLQDVAVIRKKRNSDLSLKK